MIDQIITLTLIILSSIIISMLTIIEYGIIFALWISTIAILTKPKVNKFKQDIKFYIKNNVDFNSYYLRRFIMNQIINDCVNKSDIQIKDVVVCRIGFVKFDRRELIFIGVFNYWYQL